MNDMLYNLIFIRIRLSRAQRSVGISVIARFCNLKARASHQARDIHLVVPTDRNQYHTVCACLSAPERSETEADAEPYFDTPFGVHLFLLLFALLSRMYRCFGKDEDCYDFPMGKERNNAN